jgi:phenylacetate-CoA ligase
MIQHAYDSSPFYHERFRRAGLKPHDVRTLNDLKKLPIIRKEELANNVESVLSNRFPMRELKVSRTSGSTGKPLSIYMTQSENEFRKAKHLRAQMALGQKPWHKWVTITSPLHFAETSGLQRMLRLYGVYSVSVFDDIDKQFSRFQELKPDVIDGYSNSILLLAKEVKKRGDRVIRPKFLVSGAELIDGGSRRFVEDVFEAPFYDQYACVEFERLAWQCQEKAEYHVDADSVLMQFVDEGGEEVAPGEKGEVVCTSLFNYATPFIRYGLDDIGVPSENGECKCGRTLPLMKLIEGRKTSLLSLPGGRVLAPFAFMLAVWTFKFYDSIDLYRVVQKRKDMLVFRLKLKQRGVNEELIRAELEKHIRSVLNLPAEIVGVEVEFVEDIPLDKSGKFRIVISELDCN